MKAVLWDLDDTLLDTLEPRMKALAHAHLACLGESVNPIALWRSQRGHTLEDLARRLLGDDYQRFTTTYREFYFAQSRSIRPYDGIPQVLTACRERGLALAVVTSKISWGASEELHRAGILEHFGAVVAYDDTDTHKPDPAPVFEALERLLIDDPGDVVFVGDSPADVLAARNAGCMGIAALWGTLDEELLRDAGPDAIAATPADVLTALAAGASR